MQLFNGDSQVVHSQENRVQGGRLVSEMEVWILFGELKDWGGLGVP